MTPATNAGARPEGTTSPEAAAANVQEMFNEIAPTYDRANHLLSMGLDRSWWRRAAQAFAPVLARPDAHVLDLCCGTGDLTAALLAHRPVGDNVVPVIGVDFAPEMLDRARLKYPHANASFQVGDALALAFPDGFADLVTFAFGFRNLASYAAGLTEIHRVLRPGGEFGILECNQPSGLVGAGYSLYFKKVLPHLGGLISGNPSAYRYLPSSVERFPRPPEMLRLIADAGFTGGSWTGYTLGTAGLYRATRS